MNEAGGRETVDLIKKEGGEAAFFKVDVSSEDDVKAMIKFAIDTYGRLDIMFNNAGIEWEIAPITDCSLTNFDKVIAVNLRGVFLGMKYAIREMLKQGGGVIINTASIAEMVGFANLPAYNASKGGVIQLTKTAALEYAEKNIRVNALCPGVIHTPMVERFTGGKEREMEQLAQKEPVKRMGKPEEIAAAALFLASDEASFVTGVAFPVDGGYTAE